MREVVAFDPTDSTVVRVSKTYFGSPLTESWPGTGIEGQEERQASVHRGCGDDALSFRFDRVFRDDATQEEVYRVVGSSIVDDVLDGFHSTVIAYG